MTAQKEHVVMRGKEFVCLNCGNRYSPTLPAPINVFTAMIKAFSKDHAKCKPRYELITKPMEEAA